MNFAQESVIYINKPYGMTSFGALAHVRYVLSRRLGLKRVKTGHAGTLDPLATGVLVICTGRATKRIAEMQGQTKEYEAVLQFGATTASYDREHTVNQTYPTAHITKQRVEDVLRRFVGDVEQVPPAYSACKVNGLPAYALMRQGQGVELKAKTLHIDSIELTAFDKTKMTAGIRVVCGKGTYIRALARDIGEALDSGAFITSLCRTRVGNVKVGDCVTLDDFPRWVEEKLKEEKTGNNI